MIPMRKTHDQQILEYLSGFLTERRLERMQEVVSGRTRHLCVVLEDIYQTHNASAVLRSCECFGIQDVHIIENRNVFEENPEVVLGASKWLSLYRYNTTQNNTAGCLQALKDQGYRLVATTPHKRDCLLEELPLEQKTALLFGTEMEGLSEAAMSMADAWVRIPMRGFTESFNISVSVAITLYHLSRRLRETNTQWELPPEEKVALLLEWVKKSVKNPDQILEHFKGFS
jgi:tRNA (guanosine-2'-O-)-methyltransferase